MTPDLFIAACLANLLSLILIGLPLFRLSPKPQRKTLALLVLVMLPMNALAYFLVRVPLNEWLVDLFHFENESLHALRPFYAPLTEEPAKLWPLLIPALRKRIQALPLHKAAIALGLGFGIGEAWTVAHLLSGVPEITAYPWYQLSGYITERMLVCLAHAGFTVTALVLILNHHRIATGLCCCMLLHFLGNFPIFLAKIQAFGLSPYTWQQLLTVWVNLYLICMGGLLAFFAYGKSWAKQLLRGNTICPECNTSYPHPLLGINLVTKRYERCPHCQKWHWVPMFSPANPDQD